MKLFFSSITRFFHWWTTTLISCLPQSWASYFSRINKKIDLIIAHQGDTVFIQTQKGQIIDSISLTENGIDKSVQLRSNFNELISEENKISHSKDPSILLNSESIEPTDQSPSFNLVDQTDVLDNQPWGNDIEDQTEIMNLNPVQISEEDDTTVFFDRKENSTQLLEMNVDLDEDTIIIKDDQGQLINIDSGSLQEDENTLLFKNTGGKIRPVSPGAVKPDIKGTDGDGVDNEFYQVNDTILGFDVVARLLAMYQGNKKCLYLLPDEKVFTINLSYPIEAAQNIENVLRYDLEKHIPLNLKEIRYFYALNFNSLQQKVHVEVAVIKLSDFDLLNSTLANYIDKGLLCTTESFFNKFGRKINFVEKGAEKSWFSLFETSNIHLAINSILVTMLLAIPYYLYYQNLDAIKVNTPQEIKKAHGIVSSINLISTETKFGLKLAQQLGDVPRLVSLLSVMSENVDQQAWLSRYSFKNNEIRIKGEAVSATAVSDELSNTGLFESIKFVSTIRKNPRNDKEFFELLLRVKAGA